MKELTWERHKRIVMKIAWNYSKCYHWMELDELINEGYLMFLTARDRYDNEKHSASFSTYLYQDVSGRFNSIRRRDERCAFFVEPTAPEILANHVDGFDEERRFTFLDSLRTLSADAQFCIETIWSAPGELTEWACEEMTKPKLTVKLLTRYLRTKGWTHSRIRLACSEIRKSI